MSVFDVKERLIMSMILMMDVREWVYLDAVYDFPYFKATPMDDA